MDLAFAEAIFDNYASYMVNIDRDQIIARHIETPLDHNNHSMNMMNGDIFGIGNTAGQLLGRRPRPNCHNVRSRELAGYICRAAFSIPAGRSTLAGERPRCKWRSIWASTSNLSSKPIEAGTRKGGADESIQRRLRSHIGRR